MSKTEVKPQPSDGEELIPLLGERGPQMKIEVSYRLLVLLVLGVVALWAIVRLWPVVLLVAIAIILMTALLPYVGWLTSRGLPRTAAVLLLTLVIVLALVGLFALVVPAMISQFRNIQDNLPEDARRLEELLARFDINVELQDRARNIDWRELVSGSVALDYGKRIVTTTFSVITTLVITVYLLIDTPRLSRFLYQFVAPSKQGDFKRMLASLERVVGGYVRGQLITSLCIALYTFVALRIIGVPNAMAFAVLAGFADIIPLVGAFIAIIPATVAAFDVSATHAIVTVAALFLYQQFEDRFLVPRVYGQTLNLPPLIVLIAVLCGVELLGIIGAILALPVVAAGRVALDYYMERRALPREAAEAVD